MSKQRFNATPLLRQFLPGLTPPYYYRRTIEEHIVLCSSLNHMVSDWISSREKVGRISLIKGDWPSVQSIIGLRNGVLSYLTFQIRYFGWSSILFPRWARVIVSLEGQVKQFFDPHPKDEVPEGTSSESKKRSFCRKWVVADKLFNVLLERGERFGPLGEFKGKGKVFSGWKDRLRFEEARAEK